MTINCQEKNNSITTVGERIKLVRKNSGLSQTAFAKKLELTQGFIGHIENGRNQPTVDQLMRIAIIFDCDGNWLLTGKDSAKGREAGTISEPVIYYPSVDPHREILHRKLDRILNEGDKQKIRMVEDQLDYFDPGEKKPRGANEDDACGKYEDRRVA